MKRIVIDPVLNGFLVTVGCSQVVSMDIDHLCSELKRYWQNPERVEKEYMTSAINPLKGIPLTDGPRVDRGPGEVRSEEAPTATRVEMLALDRDDRKGLR
jgi:hypothetical protein